MGKKNRVFNTLIRNYVYFSFTVGVTVVVLLVVLFYRILDEFGPTDPANHLNASEIVRQEYQQIPSESVESFGGWVEILDEDLRIIFIKGQKRDATAGYTEGDLVRLFSDLSENRYHISLVPFTSADGRDLYCLVKVPREAITRSYTNANPQEQLSTFWGLVLRTAIGFVLLFVINIYLYSRWTAATITNPLRSIAEGIRQVAAGRYQERLQFAANYEFTEIQDHFNGMAERLDRAQREKRALEESRQRMLVDISHDLKTPITTIQGYVEALQLGLIADEAKRQRTLDLIHAKARLMAELIDDLFELSKLESPDYPFTTEFLDIAELIREVAAQYYDAFEAKGLRFHFEIPAQEITVALNQKLLYRAIANLLENALKHNPTGTEVLLKLVEEGARVGIEVVDDGVGIPRTLQGRVFEAFVRGDESRRSDGGTGLGLTICKQIVQLHGGEVQLDTSQGNTRFRITLPK